MIKLIDSPFKSHKLQTTLAQFWQTQQTSGLYCPSQQLARDCMGPGLDTQGLNVDIAFVYKSEYSGDQQHNK